MKQPKIQTITLLFVALLCVATSFLASPALGSAQPSIEFIVAALQAQADNCGPSLDVTYSWVSLGTQTKGDTRATIRYLRTPTNLLLEEESERMDSTGSWVALDSSKSVHDRTTSGNRQVGVSAGSGKSIGRISHGNPNRFTSQPMIDVVYYPLLAAPLIERIAKGVVTDKQEQIDGHMCWRVDIPQEAIATNHGTSVGWTVWLDSDIGLCPRLIVERYEKDGSVSEEITRRFDDYKPLGGNVFLPMKHVIQYADGTGLNLSVIKASAGTKIEDSEFTVTFPAGTKVFTLPVGAKKPMSYVVK